MLHIVCNFDLSKAIVSYVYESGYSSSNIARGFLFQNLSNDVHNP
ncbi:hypothetical protein [Bacillus wiedmannii]|nr:hypothetical protein [Bacillus wiedmannii]